MGFWRLVEKEKKKIYGGLYTLHPSSSSCSSSFPLFFISSLPSLTYSLSCQPFQKASIFSHQAVGACCHVAMLPECQTECQSDGRAWMHNKDEASSDWRRQKV